MGAATATRVCPRCERAFNVPANNPGQRYCSVPCAARANLEQRFGPRKTRRDCPQCGRSFMPNDRRQRYCDQACGSQAGANRRKQAREAVR